MILMNNFWLPYLLIMAHFISGALWLIRINRKAESESAREQWTKYVVYLLLFNLVWHSIVWFESVFPILGYLIIAASTIEWWRTIKHTQRKVWLALAYIVTMVGFWRFLYLEKSVILFTYFVVVLFDGASQIVGQLIGRKLLVPKISPKKTVEGLIGGVVVTMATTLLVKNTFSYSYGKTFLTAGLIILAAIVGDLLASAIKRKTGIARFSNVLPGHGGILDRYDSLIVAGITMYLISLISNYF